jgi:hypothetical protein
VGSGKQWEFLELVAARHRLIPRAGGRQPQISEFTLWTGNVTSRWSGVTRNQGSAACKLICEICGSLFSNSNEQQRSVCQEQLSADCADYADDPGPVMKSLPAYQPFGEVRLGWNDAPNRSFSCRDIPVA